MPLRRAVVPPLLLVLLAGCGGEPAPRGDAAAGAPASAATAAVSASTTPAPAPAWWAADLGAVANMGFADDKAGDGAGGWSDQGWANSFAEFEVGRGSFGGVPFRITDPAANRGTAVLSFRHESFRKGLAEATATFPAGARGRYLYLLHTACWAKGAGTIGTLTVRARDGQERTAGVELGRELADWWNPVSLANGAVVVAKPNQSALVGVYLSRFDLGADCEAAAVKLTPTGAGLWIVVGATLSARDLPLPERKPLTITAGAEWKALPTTDLVVKAGSALDCSAWIDHAPAGARGRVVARADGRLAFASDPATPVRFFGCAGPDWVSAKRELEDPEAWAEAVRLQGYNLVRFHFLDFHLAGRPKWGKINGPEVLAEFDRRSAAGNPFPPAQVEALDRLVAALKKRGIYLFLDAMTSWTGCYPVNPWFKDPLAPDVRAGMYGDERARQHYAECVRALLTHRNPHTGTSLAEDPQVAVLLGYNEQENNLWSHQGWKTILVAPWRRFLAKRYADVAAFRAAWGGKDPAPGAASFAQAPLFDLSDTWAAGARPTDVADFLVEVEGETAAFMEKTARDGGYQGLFTHYDYLKNLRYFLPRAALGAVTMHGYHAHPTDFITKGSKILQASSLSDDLGWWRGIAATRIAGRPFLVTEYGHVYWNRYRYEEGLAVGAYAALQQDDMLLAHANPVRFAGTVVKSFAVGPDPINRANQVVTGFAWRGRLVAPARHRVEVAVSKAEALAQSESAIAGDQSRTLLLTGFAARVEGGPAAAPAADLTLPLQGGAKVVSTGMVSGVQDDGAPSGFAAVVAQLRAKGILPAGNRTDAALGRFESDTGEILLDARQRRLAVAAPGLAGLCADEVARPLSAGDLTVTAASVPLSASAIALDRAALAAARRVLLVVATDARNSGEQYEDSEGNMLRKLGGAPVLVRTATVALALRRDPAAPRLRAWALALDGSRADELTVTAADGALHLTLDTAAWGCGPTPFIELAER
jgi:hypothetical protein